MISMQSVEVTVLHEVDEHLFVTYVVILDWTERLAVIGKRHALTPSLSRGTLRSAGYSVDLWVYFADSRFVQPLSFLCSKAL
jgi:hypothetical protein